MKRDKLLNVFHRAADVAVAIGPAGRDCPDDGELWRFAAGQAPDEAADMLEHLMDCERCRDLARLLRSEQRTPLWAKAATRRATRRWEQELERQATYTLRLLPAAARLDFVAAAAAPPVQVGPARLRLDRAKRRLSLHLRQGDEPLAGVEVMLAQEDGAGRRSARTDEHGQVSFADLPAGEYLISAVGLSQPMTLRRGEPER